MTRRFSYFVPLVCIPLLSVHVFADATVTAKGYAFCYDGTTQKYYPMVGARVELMDSDCDGSQICDDEMGRSRVQADGSFTVTGTGGDPGWIGSDPDVYVRFAYNDDEGVRLTDELDSTRSWSTPEHDHDNTGDGAIIDFGAWSTGNGVGAGEGTQCGVWRNGRIAFQSFKAEFGVDPPAGHLDIEYWSAVYSGTPWTNTDTIHWPIHYESSALLHEFGHSIRHAADGNGSHFTYDVARFQYARTHSMCASDGNRNSGESDESLRGFAFNEGWAEYWAGDFGGCGTTNHDVEGNIAHILNMLQIDNGLKHTDMVSVLTANPGTIHSLDEFIGALQKSRVGITTRALTAGTPTRSVVNYAPYNETRRASLISSLIVQINKRISELRAQALAYRSPNQNRGEATCKNCEDIFKRVVAPVLLEGEAKTLEIRVASLKRSATAAWAQQVQSELNAGRYDAFVERYRADLRGAMRQALSDYIGRAQASVRQMQSRLSPAAFDASMSTLSKARARLDPAAANVDDPLGWLPQMPLAENNARAARPDGVPSSGTGPKSPSGASLSIAAKGGWVATGISITRGQHVTISAQGTWSNSGPPAKGPRGFENYKYPGTLMPSADLASLIAKVGETMFAIGDSFDGAGPATGELFLSINDTPDSFGDNQGALSARVTKY